MRLLWLTDIHLNFVESPRQREFLQRVAENGADVILLSGDIAEADDVAHFLTQLHSAWQTPLYFVLGNHDYYFGSIADVRRQVSDLCEQSPRLHYLTQEEVIELTPEVGLIGHDGWADARVGDYERSTVMMNDYRLIAELAALGKRERLPVLRALGEAAAEHVRRWLPAALAKYPRVFLVTHVPPLREACWHEGQISDDEWAPHFVCQALGAAVLEIMAHYPQRRLTVLCGHTHGSGVCHPLPNVEIFTGGASYGNPDIVREFIL
jgi:3',5'-cyclic-AMP phosphodiesterase